VHARRCRRGRRACRVSGPRVCSALVDPGRHASLSRTRMPFRAGSDAVDDEAGRVVAADRRLADVPPNANAVRTAVGGRRRERSRRAASGEQVEEVHPDHALGPRRGAAISVTESAEVFVAGQRRTGRSGRAREELALRLQPRRSPRSRCRSPQSRRARSSARAARLPRRARPAPAFALRPCGGARSGRAPSGQLERDLPADGVHLPDAEP
jgi:hypothetical protein